VRDLRQLINLKKIFIGEKRGMDDTCAMENIHNILLKLNQKCDLGKLVGLKNSIKEKEDEEERDRLLA
jgi:hypothetical protein